VSIVRVVGRGRTTMVDAEQFAALRAGYERVAVDVGTGDGRFAYQLASEDPQLLVVGVDALDAPMGEIAAKAARKPEKGGRDNVVFVRAPVESLPAALRGVADELFVVLPWGRRLEGVVLADPQVLAGLASLCRAGARVSITLNGEIWHESTPARYEELPVPSAEHVARIVAPGFARAGIELEPARELDAREVKELASTWARRLGHGRERPRFVQLDGVARSRPAGS
jgi:16S rRNA (adenine(1408)-N(1))-methyltransferase